MSSTSRGTGMLVLAIRVGSWLDLWLVCKWVTQWRKQWVSWVHHLYVLLSVRTFRGFWVVGCAWVTEAVVNVFFLLEMFEGFSDFLLNLQGLITLDDLVLVRIVQNLLCLSCLLFPVHDHCSSSFVQQKQYNTVIPPGVLNGSLLSEGQFKSWGLACCRAPLTANLRASAILWSIPWLWTPPLPSMVPHP